ncbi:Bug family tripartite tricarboxylate transporter substrate binding protein [Neoroseomonas lacus]|uniref:Bug family tripartite tricarboxylate transporter substrate binding protein n=1 Tax=Neoroseomonas lacus TaxID=287609 RepID=UPI001666C666|nr:tripartite tricarboxylate transporter substrate-binding protein [Neoroseomonas lacus]
MKDDKAGTPGSACPARRRAVLAAGLCGALATPALAQPAWPSRPIRWIVGFAPGGVGDLTTRLVAAKLGMALGQTVVVENRPSAGGIVAAETVARAAPDGHTLLLLTTTDATASAIYQRLSYDIMRDLEFVGQMSFFDHALVTSANSPYRTLDDVIAAARARPGSINLGSIAVGNAQHLGAELFRSMTRTDLVIVPYRSTPDLLNATATGDVQLASEILAPVLPQATGGRLRVLAVAAPQRFAGLPEVPTAEEAGVPGYVVRSWNGIAVPARTPRPIVDRLNAELLRTVALPDIREKMLELGVQPVTTTTPESFRAYVAQEHARWSQVVTQADIPRQ